jgi:hypothetical protein
LILAFVCLACGLEQDITFDEPETVPPAGPLVVVVWSEKEVDVFLDDLDKIQVDDTPVCLLWDILLAAGLEEEEILSMRFDFESENGFRPSQKGCEPLDGETLALGYLDPESMFLSWDSDLGLPGCYSVRETSRILGEAAEKRPSAVLSLLQFDLFGRPLSQSRPAQISFGTGDRTGSPTPPRRRVLRHAPLGRT